MNSKKLLTMYMLLLMLMMIFRTLQSEVVASNPSEVALIEVSATSPHVANGTDFSEVVVTAEDVYGDPVVGANITVLKVMGIDSKEAFNYTDNGDGTYSASVNSTIAGNTTIIAIELTTGVSGNATVIFEPGPAANIILEATKPRDFEPRNASTIEAVVTDGFGNQVLPPQADVVITTDMGTVSPTTVDEDGIFWATITSAELGMANITATDITTGINNTSGVVFPALCIISPSDAVLAHHTFTRTVNIFVSDPNRALGFYDFEISFNGTVIQFLNATDGDPDDEFDAPLVQVIDANAIRINQTNIVSVISPTGSIKAANITFDAVEVGYSPINITLWNNSELSLVDTQGVPVPSTPNVGEDPTVKEKKLLRLNVIMVEDSNVTKDEIKTDIKEAQAIFNRARSNCLAIQLVWDGKINIITKKQWEDEIDKNKNGLDDWPTPENPTAEEKALLKKHRKECYVNIYWVPKFTSGALGEGSAEIGTAPNVTSGVILTKEGENYETTIKSEKILAHELGHFLGVDNQATVKSDVPGPNNLMHYDGGTKLEKEQCEEMMKSNKLIKELPDFGDAPNPPYPSKLASNGARHIIWNYEWLGKTADPTPSVNGENDSKQVDLDEFDDGVIVLGDVFPGGPMNIIVIISTSNETGRYNITDRNKVMYLNAWIDLNCDGDWNDAFEKVIGTGSPTGTQKFAGPATPMYVIPVPQCDTWLRFRLDYGEDVGANRQPWTDPSLNQDVGQARYGEVEDYKVRVFCPKYPYRPWTMFHCDLARAGYSNSAGPCTNETLWKYTTGDTIYSSPAVTEGKAYVGSSDKNVYALDAETGTLVWNYTTGDMVDSSPAVVNGTVFVGSWDGILYALDAETGTLVWNYTTGDAIICSPAVADGKVFVGSSDGNFYALDAETGTLVWWYGVGDWIDSSPAVVDGKVFFGSWDGSVYALDAENGTLVWEYTTGSSIVSSPAVVNGKLYIGSTNEKVYCLDAQSGSLEWNYTTGGPIKGSPAVTCGKVFIGSYDGNVYALDAETGTIIWKSTIGAPLYSSPAVACKHKVFIGSLGEAMEGYGRIYSLDAKTGELLWTYETEGPVYSSPAIANNTLFVGSFDGRVYAIRSLHDVSITSVVPSKTVIGEGCMTKINVTVGNKGNFSETFDLIVCANSTLIEMLSITLDRGTFTNVTLTWNTTGYAKGNYTITAYATLVPYETDTGDNTLADGTVTIVHPGDLNNDCVVDIADVVLVTAVYRSKCGDLDYRPNSDIIEDCVIDIADVVAVTAHYRETDC